LQILQAAEYALVPETYINLDESQVLLRIHSLINSLPPFLK
jgi:hypothetical protein